MIEMWLCVLLSLPVETGLDGLVASGFDPLKGKRVAILTNHSAVDAHGRHLLDLIRDQDVFEIKAFLAPEHGFEGVLDQQHIPHTTEAGTQLPIYSLYGDTKRPTAKMLEGLDVLLFDIQDIGTRFYTYQTTLLYAMEACVQEKVDLVVLDRPNPIGGSRCLGPILDPDKLSFVGAFPMPVVHGMTIGELARMFQAEKDLDLKLTVIPCKNWRRSMLFDQTGLLWINPSPNMRSLTQAILYPAIGMLEYTNISVGRGTDTPFQRLGAPWIRPIEFARHLNAAYLPGVSFVPILFSPKSGPYQDEKCGGVQILLTDRNAFDPMRTSYTIFTTLKNRYPDRYEGEAYLRLLGNQDSYDALVKGKPIDEILAREGDELRAFITIRERYLIYR